MGRLRTLGLALAAACAAVAPAGAQEAVNFPSNDADLTAGAPTTIIGYLFRPSGPGPFPAVVALHGCGGLFRPGTARFTDRHREWGERLAGLGFVVLFPDSFNPRGRAEVCRADQNLILPGRERARDAYGALRYLQAQAAIRPDAVALMGWSHGGSTVLWASSRTAKSRPASLAHDFRLAVALYPGCTAALRAGIVPAFPVHLFVGEADDWTPAGPCKELASGRAGMSLTAYPDAHHGFDAPGRALRTLTGLRSTPGGTATVGTEPRARADVLAKVPALLDSLKAR